MRRLLGLWLLFAVSSGAQFVEIHVDASQLEGEIPVQFGIDAPDDVRQARLLLERGFNGPVRVGPTAALAADLAANLPEARRDNRSDLIWTGKPNEEPLVEAVEALAYAMSVDERPDGAIYYKRRVWFADDGKPLPALAAFELAAQLADTPRRASFQSAGKSVTGLAAVSADAVQVLLTRRKPSDQESEAPSFVLYVRNLPWGDGEFGVERYRLDGEHRGELVQKGAGRGGKARISAPFSAPAIELVVLRKQDAPPGAGIIRRRSSRP